MPRKLKATDKPQTEMGESLDQLTNAEGKLGGLFNLKTTMVSDLHKELDCNVEKLKYKKF